MKKLFAMLLVLCLMIPCAAFAGAEGQAVILFTNDVHCGIDDDIGYAGLSAFAKGLEASGQDVVLVDAGDAVQGAAVGTLSDGAYLIDLMNATGYDVAVPGNHEFDYGMEVFQSLVARADFPYVAPTSSITPGPLLPSYASKGWRQRSFGLTTPQGITTSSPASFQDGEGNFIYGPAGRGWICGVRRNRTAAGPPGPRRHYVIWWPTWASSQHSPWTSLGHRQPPFRRPHRLTQHGVVSTKVLNKDGQPWCTWAAPSWRISACSPFGTAPSRVP